MIKPENLLGEVLDGKYRLVDFLGKGSFGWVYSAEQILEDEFRASYAIKVLQPETPEQRKAVLQEFNAAARLSHPGLVQFRVAFDVSDGPLEEALCLVMELCEGTLSKRLQAGRRLAAEEALEVAREVAEALAWLHGQNVVHRDLKPDNVFRAGNRWKLGDLGLVRAVEGSLMSASGFKGSPQYMSPEALDSQVSTASDVWSLGVTLQEALTGVLPYSGSTVTKLVRLSLTEEPTIAPNLPPPFDAVVRGCLVKDPRARWTAQQVLEALSTGSSPAEVRASVVSRPPGAEGAAVAPRGLVARVLGALSGSRSGGWVAGSRPATTAPASRGLVTLGRNRLGMERFQVDKLGSVLVALPSGRFTMGSPEGVPLFGGEEGRDNDEIQHEVVLSRGFLLGEVPVTQAEYQAVTLSNPSGFGGNPDSPVEQVSWFEAVSFCNALSRGLGLEEAYVVKGKQVKWKGLSCPGFRLPTEAEWEYACRAGTTGARYGNLDDVAWSSSNSGSTTHPVRQKQPNAWGLYDTLGNVFEWCWDWYASYPSGVVTDPVGPGSGSYRVSRGGSWGSGAQYARAASRVNSGPGDRSGHLGFRVARSLP